MGPFSDVTRSLQRHFRPFTTNGASYPVMGPRAGSSIVPVVPWEPPSPAARAPDQLPNFYHAVLTFERAV